jgi:hypothetical protein
MHQGDDALFDVSVWKPALEKYSAVTRLTVTLHDVDERVVFCGSEPPTPFVALFEEYGYAPDILIECARQCLAQAENRVPVIRAPELLQVLADTILRENDRTRKLKTEMAAKDEFLAVVSHEATALHHRRVRLTFQLPSISKAEPHGCVTERLNSTNARGAEEKQAVNERPIAFADVESCVETVISRIGRRIRLGTPLGLGKANHIVNEFFRRARAARTLDLHIFTALTLARPRAKSDLECRLLEPLTERLFGGYPELEYVEPLRRGTLPDNIRVNEFYFQPGTSLESLLAQQQCLSSNYTHVVRDLLDREINVLAQLVARSDENGEASIGLSCNSDLTLDLAPKGARAGTPWRGDRASRAGQSESSLHVRRRRRPTRLLRCHRQRAEV